jgi:integrase
LRHIDAYQGTPVTRLAMKLMALTFVRTSELIGARWAEFDLDGTALGHPGFTPHEDEDPAHRAAVHPGGERAQTLQLVIGTWHALLFPGERDHEKSMSNNTILGALDRMGYKGRMTGHGFRGVASTLLARNGFRSCPH